MVAAPELELSGVEPEALGWAQEVGVDTLTGGAAARVAIRTTPGRQGAGPNLALVYGGGDAAAIFGDGWGLEGLPSVGYAPRDGLPRYDGTDVYAFAGEELVPMLLDGSHRTFPRGEYTVACYQPRLSRQPLRAEHWVHASWERTHWRVRQPNGSVWILGRRPDGESRIQHDASGRVWRWLAEALIEPRGNVVWVRHAPENAVGVSPAAGPNDGHAQRYPEAILYGNAAPLGEDGDFEDTDWHFEVAFDYGQRPGPIAPTPARPWEVRPDPRRTGRPGFEVITRRRCRRILMLHHFPSEFDSPTVLVGETILGHDDGLLSELGYVAHRSDAGVASRRSLPSLKFEYATAAVANAFVDVDGVPGGLRGAGKRVVDLLSEGVPGVLTETSGAWHYARGLGDGRFAPSTPLRSRPRHAANGWGWDDFDGDGNRELHVAAERYHRQNRNTEVWEPARESPRLLRLPPRTALSADVTGNGLVDRYQLDATGITYWPSLGEEGFGLPQRVALPIERLPFADAMIDRFLADMTGDGLADIVVIRNGSITYWPNLGYGRFGTAVEMDGAPRFDFEGEFDAARLFLLDLSGTGCADVLYLRRGELQYWLNSYGHRLQEGGRIDGLPFIASAAELQIADIVGDGRPALVWAPVSGQPNTPTRVLALQRDAPRQLTAVHDALGHSDEFEYASSARQYIADREAGRPWRSRAPGHHNVVARLIQRDLVAPDDRFGAAASETRYVFRDGIYDPRQRSFVGYARVEQIEGRSVPGLRSVPTRTRTVHHTGDPSFGREGGLAFYGTGVDPPSLESVRWSSEEYADAFGALAGEVVETAVFGQEAIEPGTVPVEVDGTRVEVIRESPAHAKHRAGLRVRLRESVHDQFDGDGRDPRIQHRVATVYDAYGHLKVAVDLAYPRRQSTVPRVDAQHRTLVAATVVTPIHVDTNERFEIAIPESEVAYELGVPTPALWVADWWALRADVPAAMAAALDHDDDAPIEADGERVTARVVAMARNVYADPTDGAALATGTVGAPTLLHHQRQACFEDPWLRSRLGARYDAAHVEALHYVRDGDRWWRSGPRHNYGGGDEFYQLESTLRPDGATRQFEYGLDALILVAVTDALGNRTEATIDYIAMAPVSVTDANQTQVAVRRDALGVIVRQTARGTALDGGGATDYGHGPLPAGPFEVGLDEALEEPGGALGGVASAVIYDLARSPPAVLRLANEFFETGDEPARVQVALTYLDGLRRPMQVKHLVEDGPALLRAVDGTIEADGAGPVEAGAGPRWRTAGHVVFDDRQRPVQEYDPFHSRTAAFEPDAELRSLGATTTQHFDAAGRVLRQDERNGSFSRVEYGPWSVRSFDACDTVAEPDNEYRLARETLGPEDDEALALARSLDQQGTPSETQLDPLGREIAVDEILGDRILRTTTDLDLRGEAVRISDPRPFDNTRLRRDMLGRVIVEESADAGVSWTLPDAFDRAAHVWRAEGAHVQTVFDTLDRPTEVRWLHRSEPWTVDRMRYGESAGDGVARNARGALVRHEDSAGVFEVDAYDPFGSVLRKSRTLTTEPDVPNWASTVSLEVEPFVSSFAFDAAGREIVRAPPDGTTRRMTFRRGGGLESVVVTAGDRTETMLGEAEYDARGRRTRFVLGNDVAVEHVYDPVTLELREDKAGARKDVRRTYDALGRVVREEDLRQRPGSSEVLRGQSATAEREYRYDSLHRLVWASGRYHRALRQDDHRRDSDVPQTYRGTRHVNDGTQVSRYIREFAYDDAGNLERLEHRPDVGHAGEDWSVDKWVSETSNRQLPATDLDGDAWPSPEDLFDREGRCLRLSTVEDIAWDDHGRLARATVVAREPGRDDEEVYQYGGDGIRVRKRSQRLKDEANWTFETIDVIVIDGAELTRKRLDGEVRVTRWTSRITDEQGVAIGTLYRWDEDRFGSETDRLDAVRVHYSLTDPRGSVTDELGETGGRITYEEYFPYGGSAYVHGDLTDDVPKRTMRYAGKTQDDATGLYYFEHRYYAPFIGNWVSADPAGDIDGPNRFRFVLGDPVNRVDPDGRLSFVLAGGVVVTGAGLVAAGVVVVTVAVIGYAVYDYTHPPSGSRRAQELQILGAAVDSEVRRVRTLLDTTTASSVSSTDDERWGARPGGVQSPATSVGDQHRPNVVQPPRPAGSLPPVSALPPPPNVVQPPRPAGSLPPVSALPPRPNVVQPPRPAGSLPPVSALPPPPNVVQPPRPAGSLPPVGDLPDPGTAQQPPPRPAVPAQENPPASPPVDQSPPQDGEVQGEAPTQTSEPGTAVEEDVQSERGPRSATEVVRGVVGELVIGALIGSGQEGVEARPIEHLTPTEAKARTVGVWIGAGWQVLSNL